MEVQLASRLLAQVLLLIGCLLPLAFGDEYTHRYEPDEEVILWVNKVGPYYNPQETYTYYTLPFCRDSSKPENRRWGGLGEVLEGNELTRGDYDIKFLQNIDHKIICNQKLDDTATQFFSYAVESHYWYQLYMDDLPIWGMVGEISNEKGGEEEGEEEAAKGPESFSIYTHKKLDIGYNKDRIIEVNLTWDNPVQIEKGQALEWSYSINWVPTETPFQNRFHKYLDNDFFEHQIHWFSIFNSFMMVIFLTGLVSLILMRTLRNDYARFTKDPDDLEDMGRDMGDEYGWKQLQGDVFRFPPYLSVFAALVGVGLQIAIVVFGMVLLAIISSMYTGRGATISAFIACYAVTSLMAGYVSGGLYAKSKGQLWIRTMVITALIFPMITCGIAFPLNFVAIAYTSLAAIPFGTMIVILLIWAFVAFPLTLIGTVLGRNWSGTPNFPCRVNSIPRHIPEKKWYLQTHIMIMLGGVLPFGSIFIEMYFVFTSFWNYKFYYVYGFMLLVFIILVIVSLCVTVVSTYFLLNAEDYRWQWISFLSSASTAVYVFLYAIYYFFVKTKMYGFFQTTFYFGYMTMFCLSLAVMCGAIGYWGSHLFVHRIYRNIKSD